MFLQLHAHTSTTKTKKEKTQSSCREEAYNDDSPRYFPNE